jgi:creatinine amidohydrolase
MSSVSGILDEMTLEDVRALAANVVVVPLGSTEPHGAALPYGTDTFAVDAVARQATRVANARGARVLCYPTWPITLNNNFRHWPFAGRTGVPAFMTMLADVLRQIRADGVKRAVVINGHGGTTDVIRAVLRDLAGRDDVPFTCTINSWEMVDDSVAQANVGASSQHGGEDEVSYQMFLRPDLVRRERLADNPEHQPAVPCLRSGKVHFVRPWHLYVPLSAGGDQRRASAEKGRALVESAVEQTARFLVDLSQAPDSPNFPY